MFETESEILSFQDYLIRLGYHESSVQILPYAVREFFDFIDKPIASIESCDIVSYHNYLQERPNKRYSGGLSEQYIYKHLYGIRLFFTWQLEKGSLVTHPMSSIKVAPPSYQARMILSQQEIQLLYASCKSSKERAVLAVLYGCGLRKSEAESLNLVDVDFTKGLLYVRRGKYAKRRAVPLGGQVQQDLAYYVEYGRYSKHEDAALLYNRHGKRMRGYSMSYILNSLLKRSNITKLITLHCLRHSIASHLLENGLSVEYVRDFLGHRHLESTQIYTRINQEQLWSLNSI